MESKKQTPLSSVFRYPILLLQICGYMPVSGIFQNDPNKTTFSWKNFRTIYALTTCFGFLFLTTLQIFRSTVRKTTINDIQKIIFYSISLITNILLLVLAKKWKGFVQGCDILDKQMAGYDWPKNLKKRVNIALVILWVTFLGKAKIFRLQ